jgi:two-component system, chemotaxis family, chemotaxis protein CheY
MMWSDIMQKVLLINDCRFESLIMKDMLKNIGYEVSITDEYEAMSEVREFAPDIIICNLIMKEIKGNLLIRRINAMHPEIKCYLSSSNELKLEDYKNDRVNEIIHTPVKPESLEKILKGKEKEYKGNTSESQRKFSFCSYCGGKLENLNINAAFCPYCGSKL